MEKASGLAMFSPISSSIIPAEDLPTKALKTLNDHWSETRFGALPRLKDLDPSLVGLMAGRVHLMHVQPGGAYRFLHYARATTNPDGLNMSGRTTADYADRVFGAMVEEHYGEAVRLGRPVCRKIAARWRGQPYEYVRLTMPYSADGGPKVVFLVVASHRLTIPGELDRDEGPPDESESQRLAATIASTARASQLTSDPEMLAALDAIEVAAEIRLVEARKPPFAGQDS
jgi:hypothetical protein